VAQTRVKWSNQRGSTAADSVEAAARIAAAVAAGELTATEAAELAKVIDT
jgi:hypothetical protein